MIKAPYNFVPLSEKVFYPPWADQVSHDVPFSDGESGEINITITAKSPIFIRNHEVDTSDEKFYDINSKKEKISTEFCHHKGEYYIPATSVKGMLRNILEIITFSRIPVVDKKFAYRDFDEEYYKTKLLNNTDKIHMGWLYNSDGVWCIEDLGNSNKGSNRIKYDDMTFDNKDKVQTENTALKKYKLTNERNPITNDGVIVFTGKVGREKTREFIFPKSNQSNIRYTYNPDDLLITNFKEAYYIGTANENELWKNLFSKRFKRGEKIPVFFLLNDDNSAVESFGLSQLYKLPYKYSIHEGIGEHAKELEKTDLSEAIFGYSKTIDNENISLRGRVQFSHFEHINNKTPLSKIKKVLSSPRAGYFPMYAKDGNSMDTKYTISGWKRYPVHAISKNNNDNNGTDAMATYFAPLPEESMFRGKIRFHNLRKSEIGALIKALDLGDLDHYYSLGMAKPYGFGKITIETNIKLKYKKDEYINSFKTIIDDNAMWDGNKPFQEWESSEQMVELLAMMKAYKDELLVYGENGKKGFEYYAQFKNSKTKRIKYSDFPSFKPPTKRTKIEKKIQIRKLAEELSISSSEILEFAHEENIDIENEFSFVLESIADEIRKYL